MNPVCHDKIKQWFSEFSTCFGDRQNSLPVPLQRKIHHSHAVAETAASIAGELLMDVGTAEIAGLLHDVGRWPQYAKFQTFRDSESQDHGALGAEVLKQHQVLADCSNIEGYNIETAVRHHNAKTVPLTISGDALIFTQIIRDSDKLDIYEVVLALMHSGELIKDPTLCLNTNLHGPLTPEAILEIQGRKTISFKHIHSLNDFLLTLLSWVYEINFKPSFKRLADGNIPDRIAQFLPRDPCVNRLIRDASTWIKSCQDAGGNA